MTDSVETREGFGAPRRWRGRLWWAMAILAALGVASFLILFIIVPGYKQPTSRLYTTPLGYPSLLRLLGKPIPVSITRVDWDTIAETVLARGEIDAEGATSVSTSLQEVAVAVHVDVGSRVRKGQLLVELKSDSYQKEYERAEADVREKRANLKKTEAGFRPEAARQTEHTLGSNKAQMEDALTKLKREQALFKEGVSPYVAVEEALLAYDTARNTYMSQLEQVTIAKGGREEDIKADQARLDSALATLELKQVQLERTRIFSPMDGVVTERSINPGEVTKGSTSALLTIAQQMTFRANVDQRQTGRIQRGQEVEVFLDAYPRQKSVGAVGKIRPALDTQAGGAKSPGPAPGRPSLETTATFSVWVRLLPNQHVIVPGLSGFAKTEVAMRALVVPPSAVFHMSGSEGLVFVVADGKPRARPVLLGTTSKGKTQILEGLQKDEWVIVSGNEALRDGDLIEITRRD